MANTPYYTKAEADSKNQEVFRDIKQTTEAISAGEGGKSYATLADAQAVSPAPEDGTVFQVEESANEGYWKFDSLEAGGTKFLKPFINKANSIEPQNEDVVTSEQVYELTTRGKSLGFIKNIFPDPGLKSASSITINTPSPVNTSFNKSSSFNIEFVDSEVIPGHTRIVKTTVVSNPSSGTRFQLNCVASDFDFTSNQVNFTGVFKFPVDVDAEVAIYMQPDNTYIVPNRSISFKAGESKTIEISLTLTDTQIANLTYLKLFLYHYSGAVGYEEMKGQSFYAAAPVIYHGEKKNAPIYDIYKNDLISLRAQGKDIIPYTNFTYDDGYYIDYSTGVKTAHANFRTIDLPAENFYLTTILTGGSVVALAAYYDASGNYLGYQEKGTTSSTVEYNDLELILPEGTDKIIITTNISNTISVGLKDWNVASKDFVKNQNKPQKIQTWGDSLTAAGQYQKGIASELQVSESVIKNAGIASDHSQHIRRRFLSYFTDATPFVGTGTYSVPSLSDRLTELNDSFFVFWMGTNNLNKWDRTGDSLTTGSSAYNALQPNPDFKFDRMYARAYVDQWLNDLRQITQKIPHGNFAIIGGHGGFMAESPARDIMNELDQILVRMYPRNVIDLRELFLMDYDYLNTFLVSDFVKPDLNASVNIELTDVTWIGDSEKNISSEICIGTKEIYDRYRVDSLNGNIATCTLIETNSEFIEGDTIRSNYNLVSDLGRDEVLLNTQVFSYEDVVSFSLRSFPRSATDPIHFTNEAYIRAGELIGKEIKKIHWN